MQNSDGQRAVKLKKVVRFLQKKIWYTKMKSKESMGECHEIYE